MKKYLVTFAIVFSAIRCEAQSALSPSYCVLWENGDQTLLSDIGKVWIKLQSGTTLKDVKIWEINLSTASLTYEKGGTLHDLSIAKINYIAAGHNSRNLLYVDQENNLKIKSAGALFDEYDNYTDFKVSRTAYESKKFNVHTQDTAREKNIIPPKQNGTGEANPDIIVKPDGSLIYARIVSISAKEIVYKRSDVPDGPDYVISINSCSEIIKTSTNYKIIMNKK